MTFDPAIQEILETPLFSVFITLLGFQLGVMAYERVGRKVWMHPVLAGSFLVAGFIAITPMEFETYKQGSTLLVYFLGTVSVALAVPLRLELKALRGLVIPASLMIVVASVIAPLSALGFAWLFGGDTEILVSMITKTVTSPMAYGIAESIGGIVALSTAITVFTGVVGALLGPPIFKWVGLSDDRLQGLLLGTLAHGVGTMRGFEISVRCGALAGLSMGITGTVSAFVLPYMHSLLF